MENKESSESNGEEDLSWRSHSRGAPPPPPVTPLRDDRRRRRSAATAAAAAALSDAWLSHGRRRSRAHAHAHRASVRVVRGGSETDAGSGSACGGRGDFAGGGDWQGARAGHRSPTTPESSSAHTPRGHDATSAAAAAAAAARAEAARCKERVLRLNYETAFVEMVRGQIERFGTSYKRWKAEMTEAKAEREAGRTEVAPLAATDDDRRFQKNSKRSPWKYNEEVELYKTYHEVINKEYDNDSCTCYHTFTGVSKQYTPPNIGENWLQQLEQTAVQPNLSDSFPKQETEFSLQSPTQNKTTEDCSDESDHWVYVNPYLCDLSEPIASSMTQGMSHDTNDPSSTFSCYNETPHNLNTIAEDEINDKQNWYQIPLKRYEETNMNDNTEMKTEEPNDTYASREQFPMDNYLEWRNEEPGARNSAMQDSPKANDPSANCIGLNKHSDKLLAERELFPNKCMSCRNTSVAEACFHSGSVKDEPIESYYRLGETLKQPHTITSTQNTEIFNDSTKQKNERGYEENDNTSGTENNYLQQLSQVREASFQKTRVPTHKISSSDDSREEIDITKDREEKTLPNLTPARQGIDARRKCYKSFNSRNVVPYDPQSKQRFFSSCRTHDNLIKHERKKYHATYCIKCNEHLGLKGEKICDCHSVIKNEIISTNLSYNIKKGDNSSSEIHDYRKERTKTYKRKDNVQTQETQIHFKYNSCPTKLYREDNGKIKIQDTLSVKQRHTRSFENNSSSCKSSGNQPKRKILRNSRYNLVSYERTLNEQTRSTSRRRYKSKWHEQQPLWEIRTTTTETRSNTETEHSPYRIQQRLPSPNLRYRCSSAYTSAARHLSLQRTPSKEKKDKQRLPSGRYKKTIPAYLRHRLSNNKTSSTDAESLVSTWREKSRKHFKIQEVEENFKHIYKRQQYVNSKINAKDTLNITWIRTNVKRVPRSKRMKESEDSPSSMKSDTSDNKSSGTENNRNLKCRFIPKKRTIVKRSRFTGFQKVGYHSKYDTPQSESLNQKFNSTYFGTETKETQKSVKCHTKLNVKKKNKNTSLESNVSEDSKVGSQNDNMLKENTIIFCSQKLPVSIALPNNAKCNIQPFKIQAEEIIESKQEEKHTQTPDRTVHSIILVEIKPKKSINTSMLSSSELPIKLEEESMQCNEENMTTVTADEIPISFNNLKTVDWSPDRNTDHPLKITISTSLTSSEMPSSHSTQKETNEKHSVINNELQNMDAAIKETCEVICVPQKSTERKIWSETPKAEGLRNCEDSQTEIFSTEFPKTQVLFINETPYMKLYSTEHQHLELCSNEIPQTELYSTVPLHEEPFSIESPQMKLCTNEIEQIQLCYSKTLITELNSNESPQIELCHNENRQIESCSREAPEIKLCPTITSETEVFSPDSPKIELKCFESPLSEDFSSYESSNLGGLCVIETPNVDELYTYKTSRTQLCSQKSPQLEPCSTISPQINVYPTVTPQLSQTDTHSNETSHMEFFSAESADLEELNSYETAQTEELFSFESPNLSFSESLQVKQSRSCKTPQGQESSSSNDVTKAEGLYSLETPLTEEIHYFTHSSNTSQSNEEGADLSRLSTEITHYLHGVRKTNSTISKGNIKLNESIPVHVKALTDNNKIDSSLSTHHSIEHKLQTMEKYDKLSVNSKILLTPEGNKHIEQKQKYEAEFQNYTISEPNQNIIIEAILQYNKTESEREGQRSQQERKSTLINTPMASIMKFNEHNTSLLTPEEITSKCTENTDVKDRIQIFKEKYDKVENDTNLEICAINNKDHKQKSNVLPQYKLFSFPEIEFSDKRPQNDLTNDASTFVGQEKKCLHDLLSTLKEDNHEIRKTGESSSRKVSKEKDHLQEEYQINSNLLVDLECNKSYLIDSTTESCNTLIKKNKENATLETKLPHLNSKEEKSEGGYKRRIQSLSCHCTDAFTNCTIKESPTASNDRETNIEGQKEVEKKKKSTYFLIAKSKGYSSSVFKSITKCNPTLQLKVSREFEKKKSFLTTFTKATLSKHDLKTTSPIKELNRKNSWKNLPVHKSISKINACSLFVHNVKNKIPKSKNHFRNQMEYMITSDVQRCLYKENNPVMNKAPMCNNDFIKECKNTKKRQQQENAHLLNAFTISPQEKASKTLAPNSFYISSKIKNMPRIVNNSTQTVQSFLYQESQKIKTQNPISFHQKYSSRPQKYSIERNDASTQNVNTIKHSLVEIAKEILGDDLSQSIAIQTSNKKCNITRQINNADIPQNKLQLLKETARKLFSDVNISEKVSKHCESISATKDGKHNKSWAQMTDFKSFPQEKILTLKEITKNLLKQKLKAHEKTANSEQLIPHIPKIKKVLRHAARKILMDKKLPHRIANTSNLQTNLCNQFLEIKGDSNIQVSKQPKFKENKQATGPQNKRKVPHKIQVSKCHNTKKMDSWACSEETKYLTHQLGLMKKEKSSKVHETQRKPQSNSLQQNSEIHHLNIDEKGDAPDETITSQKSNTKPAYRASTSLPKSSTKSTETVPTRGDGYGAFKTLKIPPYLYTTLHPSSPIQDLNKPIYSVQKDYVVAHMSFIQRNKNKCLALHSASTSTENGPQNLVTSSSQTTPLEINGEEPDHSSVSIHSYSTVKEIKEKIHKYVPHKPRHCLTNPNTFQQIQNYAMKRVQRKNEEYLYDSNQTQNQNSLLYYYNLGNVPLETKQLKTKCQKETQCNEISNKGSLWNIQYKYGEEVDYISDYTEGSHTSCQSVESFISEERHFQFLHDSTDTETSNIQVENINTYRTTRTTRPVQDRSISYERVSHNWEYFQGQTNAKKAPKSTQTPDIGFENMQILNDYDVPSSSQLYFPLQHNIISNKETVVTFPPNKSSSASTDVNYVKDISIEVASGLKSTLYSKSMAPIEIVAPCSISITAWEPREENNMYYVTYPTQGQKTKVVATSHFDSESKPLPFSKYSFEQKHVHKKLNILRYRVNRYSCIRKNKTEMRNNDKRKLKKAIKNYSVNFHPSLPRIEPEVEKLRQTKVSEKVLTPLEVIHEESESDKVKDRVVEKNKLCKTTKSIRNRKKIHKVALSQNSLGQRYKVPQGHKIVESDIIKNKSIKTDNRQDIDTMLSSLQKRTNSLFPFLKANTYSLLSTARSKSQSLFSMLQASQSILMRSFAFWCTIFCIFIAACIPFIISAGSIISLAICKTKPCTNYWPTFKSFFLWEYSLTKHPHDTELHSIY